MESMNFRLPQRCIHRCGSGNVKDSFRRPTAALFLDEVADLPLMMQVKLLQVIQEKRYASWAQQ